LVILVHGTPDFSNGGDLLRKIKEMSPVDFNNVAVAFAQRGYAAVAIMRRGFGRSGGTYSERLQQACDYLPSVRSSGEDVVAAITALREEPWVDANRVVLLGLSTGGLAVTAAVATNPPGVVAVLNFDGGRQAQLVSEQDCGAEHLLDTVGKLGRTARIPALWLYAENDQFFGPGLARRMFEAYTANGAPAQLHMLPPFGANGHLISFFSALR
jgi:dienelactone hydrolase